jgi:hypothetical protein
MDLFGCSSTLKAMGSYIIHHPTDLLGQLIDWNDWSHGRYAVAAGHVLPSLVLTLATFGTGGVVAKGGEAAGLTEEAASLSADAAAAEETAIGLGTEEGGYSSFSAAKSGLGSPGSGNVYDHLVEQSQVGKSGFSLRQVNNPENLNPVPSELNQIKANYYNSIQPFSNGLRVRNWLAGQTFEDQWNFGMSVTEDIWNGAIR